MREGSALLQGLARCGHCAPSYFRPHIVIGDGDSIRCQRIGARKVDEAVAANVPEAVRSGGPEATRRAIEQAERERA